MEDLLPFTMYTHHKPWSSTGPSIIGPCCDTIVLAKQTHHVATSWTVQCGLSNVRGKFDLHVNQNFCPTFPQKGGEMAANFLPNNAGCGIKIFSWGCLAIALLTYMYMYCILSFQVTAVVNQVHTSNTTRVYNIY